MGQTASRTLFDPIYLIKQHMLETDLGYVSLAMESTLIDQRIVLGIYHEPRSI